MGSEENTGMPVRRPLVRQDGERGISVDPLPSHPGRVPVHSQHTIIPSARSSSSNQAGDNAERTVGCEAKGRTHPTLVGAKYSKIPCDTSIQRFVHDGQVSWDVGQQSQHCTFARRRMQQDKGIGVRGAYLDFGNEGFSSV